MKKTYGCGVLWHIPGKKKPIATSTQATSDLIVALSADGGTIRDVYAQINYDVDAKAIMQKYIELGYGDIIAKEWFG